MAVTIDESRPINQIDVDEGAIVFTNPNGNPVDERGIRNLLAGSDCSNITCLTFNISSRIDSLWMIPLLKNLRRIEIENSSLKDVSLFVQWRTPRELVIENSKFKPDNLDIIANIGLNYLQLHVGNDAVLRLLQKCNRIRNLGLYKWINKDLQALQSLCLSHLYLLSCKLETVAGISVNDLLEVTRCTRLADVSSANVRYLSVMNCNRLNYQALETMKYLNGIKLNHQQLVPGFMFLPGQIKDLEILSPTRPQDALSLRRLSNLQNASLSLSASTNESIHLLAREKPGLLIENGHVAYFNGREISQTEFSRLYFDRWKGFRTVLEQ